MTSSTLITDYIGHGTHAARPATPNVPTACSPLYYETDTLKTFIWSGSAWVAISSTASTGLYNQVMSATPTQTGTGFTTQVIASFGGHPTPTFADTTTGVNILSASNATNFGWYGLSKAAPATANKTGTALIAFNSPWYGTDCIIGFGYTNGTKLQMLDMATHPGATGPLLTIDNFSDKNTYANSSGTAGATIVPALLWMQLRDDGANIHFATSTDGANFTDFYSATYAASYIGSAPTNVIFGICPYSLGGSVTLMSYAET